MSVEEVFTKVLGRQASEHERERLCGPCDAPGHARQLRSGGIVMALAHYDAYFRAYSGATGGGDGTMHRGCAVSVRCGGEKETAEVQWPLSEQVGGGERGDRP